MDKHRLTFRQPKLVLKLYLKTENAGAPRLTKGFRFNAPS